MCDVRHQQQARAFERAASHHDRAARLDFAVFSRRLVDKADARGQSLRVDVDLVRHRVGNQREFFGIFLHQRRDLAERRVVERVGLAAVLAAAAIMALGVSVVSPGQHRAAHANGAQPDFFSRPLDSQVGTFERHGRQEIIAVGQVGMILLRAANAHEDFGLVVIGRDVFIFDRPIKPLAVN
jgi:hypothetical protein